MAKRKNSPVAWTKPRRSTSEFLRKIQRELLPDHAKEFVAINTDTGEYTLGKLPNDAFTTFLARWPDSPMYLCRVDGGPAAKFYGM
jgi:hypothetical protein